MGKGQETRYHMLHTCFLHHPCGHLTAWLAGFPINSLLLVHEVQLLFLRIPPGKAHHKLHIDGEPYVVLLDITKVYPSTPHRLLGESLHALAILPPPSPANSTNFADLFCRLVGFLNFANLFCRFVGFL